MNTELVKWTALAAMLVEHFCRVALGIESLIVSGIGRLAFPLFVLLAAYNVVHRSRSVRGYAARFLLWGVVSYWPWTLAFGHAGLNVLVTLGLGVWLSAWFCNAAWWPRAAMLALCAAVYVVEFVTAMQLVEFGVCGVLSVVMAVEVMRSGRASANESARHTHAVSLVALQFLLMLSNCPSGSDASAGVLGVVAAVAVYLWPVMSGSRWSLSLPRVWPPVFYALYPAHLLIFSLIGSSQLWLALVLAAASLVLAWLVRPDVPVSTASRSSETPSECLGVKERFSCFVT